MSSQDENQGQVAALVAVEKRAWEKNRRFVARRAEREGERQTGDGVKA